MKRSNQIHVRVKPETRKMWDTICEKSDIKTQSTLFRTIVAKIYQENKVMNRTKNIDDAKL